MGEAFISLFKFILFVFLLPGVIGVSTTFGLFFENYQSQLRDFLFWGAEAFLITFLFVHPFKGVFDFSQKIVVSIFKFLAPLDTFFGSLIPIYTSILIGGLFITEKFIDIAPFKYYFIFFIGFTYAMHIILIAQQLQEQEKAFIKPSYFLMMSIIYIFNICIAILFMGFLSNKFIFPDFFKTSISATWDIYLNIINKISMVKPS